MERDTTVNIDSQAHERLLKAAGDLGVSRNELVATVIAYSCLKEGPLVVRRGLVQYQCRDGKSSRSRIHVRFREGEYEFFQDLRKVRKMSVSLILAEAIEKYLDELVHRIEKRPDNYRFQNYASSRIMIDDVVCWVLYWGIPKKLLARAG